MIRFLYSLLLFPLSFLYAQEPSHCKRSICLFIREDYRGEREFAERMRIAGENLGWKVKITNPYSYQEIDTDYDWIFTLAPEKNFSFRQKEEYLILFDPVNHYFNWEGLIKKWYLNFAGYLTTYEPTALFLEDIKENKKRFYPKRWYPTVQYRAYRKVNPMKLFYFIGHWGDRRTDQRYQTMQYLLAQTDYANLFGNAYIGKNYGKAFKGEINYDGESVINRISEMGVCLIFHSKIHLQHKIPSGRIFEAAAASAVIISDLNPFVIKHFRDSVLYVNQELSGEEMFKQIDEYMIWIKNHPQEALKKAQRAHQIFEEKFLLEQQLLDFSDYIESLQLIESDGVSSSITP